MANYVIDPLNAAEPTDARAAGYAAEEMRAMKGILAGLAGSPTAESLVSWKNRFANGGMRFDQTNSGGIVTVNSGGAFNCSDCLQAGAAPAAGTYTVQQLTAGSPPGYSAFTRVTRGTQDAAPAAGSFYQVFGLIEGLDIADLQWQSANALAVSYQFMFRTSLTGARTWGGSIRNNTGGRSYPVTWTTETANVWKLITLPNIPGDTAGTWLIDNQRSMLLTIDVGSGANARGTANAWSASDLVGVTGTERLISSAAADTFDFTGLQLERGPVCTPFETMPFQAQLARVQRYLVIYTGNGLRIYGGRTESAAAAVAGWPLPVPMRVIPTTTAIDIGNININDGSVGAAVSSVSTNYSSVLQYAQGFSCGAVTTLRPIAVIFGSATAALIVSARL